MGGTTHNMPAKKTRQGLDCIDLMLGNLIIKRADNKLVRKDLSSIKAIEHFSRLSQVIKT